MLKRNNFLLCLIFSILLHLLILHSVSRNKKNHVYLTSPIEVTFYSPSQQTSYQSTSEGLVGYSQTSGQISHQTISEDSASDDGQTNTLQTKEEIVIKKDIAAKKKDNKKKVTNEKSKIQPKKATTRSVKQIARNQAKEGNFLSDDSDGIETFQSAGSLLLSSTGSAGGGGSPYGSASVSFGPQDFKYPYYTNQIMTKIIKQWQRTESYGKLSAIVYFKIRKDGTAYDISIEESSGNSKYDKDALDAIRRATPFSELPENYDEKSLGIFFKFDYYGN
jgi:TonB family protein